MLVKRAVNFVFLMLFIEFKFVELDSVPGSLSVTFVQFGSNRSLLSYWSENRPQFVSVLVRPYITTASYFYTPEYNDSGLEVITTSVNNKTVDFHGYSINLIIPNPSEFLIFNLRVLMALSRADYDIEFQAQALSKMGTFPVLTKKTLRKVHFSSGEWLTFYITYTCGLSNYYGINCDTYCKKQTNTSSKYCFTCDAISGERICCDCDVYDLASQCRRFPPTTTTLLPGNTTVSPTTITIPEDKSVLYFGLMIGFASLLLVTLLLVILVLLIRCLCKKSEDSSSSRPSRYLEAWNSPCIDASKVAVHPRFEPAMNVSSRFNALAPIANIDRDQELNSGVRGMTQRTRPFCYV